MTKAIDLAREFDDTKVLSLALSQKGTVLRLEGYFLNIFKALKSLIRIFNFKVLGKNVINFKGKDDEALDCFKLAAHYGNNFAKQQTVCLNPYAALCNKMLGDLFEKVKSGQI